MRLPQPRLCAQHQWDDLEEVSVYFGLVGCVVFHRTAEKSFSKSWRRRKPYTRHFLQSWSGTSPVIQKECRSSVSAAIGPTLSVYCLLPLNGRCISIWRKCNSPFLFIFKCTIHGAHYGQTAPYKYSYDWCGGVGVVGNPIEIVIKCTNRYLTNWTKSMNQDLLHWVVYMSLLGSVAMCLYWLI